MESKKESDYPTLLARTQLWRREWDSNLDALRIVHWGLFVNNLEGRTGMATF